MSWDEDGELKSHADRFFGALQKDSLGQIPVIKLCS